MILPIQYEPKVENRWSVILPDNFNIYGFLCFATERPKIKYEFDDSGNPYKISYEPIVLKIYDLIKPSSTKKSMLTESLSRHSSIAKHRPALHVVV